MPLLIDNIAEILFSSYFHEDVRAAAFESLGQLTVAAHSLWPSLNGMPVVGGNASLTFSPEVNAVLSAALPKLVEGTDDDDKHATAAAFQVTSVCQKYLNATS